LSLPLCSPNHKSEALNSKTLPPRPEMLRFAPS
jgi:hypothetical protein